MTDAQFCKKFKFKRYRFRAVHDTNWMTPSGCPEHYLARLVQGTAKICTGTGTLHLLPGDIFYIPMGLQYHSHWYPEENGVVEFYSFGFPLCPSGVDTRYSLQKISCAPQEQALFSQMESDLQVTALSIGRLYGFLGTVYQKLRTEAPPGSTQTLSKALEFMRQSKEFSVGDVARHCGVSESALYIKFRDQLGKTPVQVQHEILAEKAKELLSTTDLSIERISNRLGFSSTSYFRKIFRRQTGTTPTAYRKRSHTM